MESAFPLSVCWRFYIYALHGYATEVTFTGLWEFYFHLNWKFIGHTSIFTLPIYGMSGMVCEQIHKQVVRRGTPILIRGFVYMMWTYFWEFSTGFFLQQFDMCPWDYTHYNGDFMGLITLEYAPFWFILGLIVDQLVLPFTLQLYWGPTHKDVKVCKPEKED